MKKNTKNLALARMHREVQQIHSLLKNCCIIGNEESVICHQDILDAIE